MDYHLESPLDGIPTGRKPHQNVMYQWVFRTVGIPCTEERNPYQNSVHTDWITCSYSLSYTCVNKQKTGYFWILGSNIFLRLKSKIGHD